MGEVPHQGRRAIENTMARCLGHKQALVLKFYSRGGDLEVGTELVSNCREAGS